MIFDRIENCGLYFPPDTLMARGIKFIQTASTENLPDGRHELGGKLYATVQTYRTAGPDGKNPESHRDFADMQALISGWEVIGWLPTAGLKTKTAHDPEKDIAFYENSADESPLVLRPGLFAVFYPTDAHKPGCCVIAPEEVRKVVVKIPLK